MKTSKAAVVMPPDALPVGPLVSRAIRLYRTWGATGAPAYDRARVRDACACAMEGYGYGSYLPRWLVRATARAVGVPVPRPRRVTPDACPVDTRAAEENAREAAGLRYGAPRPGYAMASTLRGFLEGEVIASSLRPMGLSLRVVLSDAEARAVADAGHAVCRLPMCTEALVRDAVYGWRLSTLRAGAAWQVKLRRVADVSLKSRVTSGGGGDSWAPPSIVLRARMDVDEPVDPKVLTASQAAWVERGIAMEAEHRRSSARTRAARAWVKSLSRPDSSRVGS